MLKIRSLLRLIGGAIPVGSNAYSFAASGASIIGSKLPPGFYSPVATSGNDEPKADVVAGLDIGTSKIVVVAGRKSADGKMEVIGMGEAPSGGLRRGTIINLATTTAGIKAAIVQASQNANYKIDIVHTGISGTVKSFCDHGIISRKNVENEIQPHDLMQLKHEMGQAIIPPGQSIIFMQPLNFMVDGLPGIRDAVGMIGSRLEADFRLITADGKASTAVGLLKMGLNKSY